MGNLSSKCGLKHNNTNASDFGVTCQAIRPNEKYKLNNACLRDQYDTNQYQSILVQHSHLIFVGIVRVSKQNKWTTKQEKTCTFYYFTLKLFLFEFIIFWNVEVRWEIDMTKITKKNSYYWLTGTSFYFRFIE